ncbi:hypothetical protein MRX96_057522 [Rhipicephalus microplus]
MDASSSNLRERSTTTGARSEKEPRTSSPEPEVTSADKPPLNKSAPNELLRLAVVIAVVVTPFLFVIVLSVVLEVRSYLASSTKQQFCCPNELRTVLRGVNPSIDPCEDFYGHVCSRIDAGEVRHVSPLYRVIQQLNLLETATPGKSSSTASEMIVAIKRGVWDAERSGSEDIGDYVTAITKALHLAPVMDLLRMIRLLAELSLSPFENIKDGDWNEIVNDLVLSVHPNVNTIHTYQDEKVNTLLGYFTHSPHQPATIAYIAICSALKTRDVIEEAAVTPGAWSLSTCQVLDICEIEQVYMAHVLSGHHMNEYVTALFTKMRDNVIQHASASLHKVSQEEVAGKLHGLRLVLPEQIVVSDIPVPAVTGTFPNNFLADSLVRVRS